MPRHVISLCPCKQYGRIPLSPAPQLIVRSLRKTDAQRGVDPEDMGGGFSAVNHALSHFPDSAEAVLAMAIVQAFGQNDVHSAHSSVQKARGMPVSLVSRALTRN